MFVLLLVLADILFSFLMLLAILLHNNAEISGPIVAFDHNLERHLDILVPVPGVWDGDTLVPHLDN